MSTNTKQTKDKGASDKKVSNTTTPSKVTQSNREKRERSSPGVISSSKSTKQNLSQETIDEECESAKSDTSSVINLSPDLIKIINTVVEKATTPLIKLIETQNATIEALTVSLNNFIAAQSKDKEDITLLKDKIDSLLGNIDAHQHTIMSQQRRIETTENQIDELEQYSRRASLRFKNVPIDKIPTRHLRGDRPTLDTDACILNICNRDLNIPVNREDIDRSHVLGKPDSRGRVSIICKFINYRTRSSIFYSKKCLKNKPDKVFIVEDLTKYRVRMIGKLNDLYRNKMISSFWTNDGRIFYKRSTNSDAVLAKSLDDITNAFPIDR